MGLVTSSASTNNHNLYFSKDELAKILNLYSKGVSNGEWKDYAIDFNKNNAFFYIFKHSLAAPECILNKSLERKKRKMRPQKMKDFSFGGPGPVQVTSKVVPKRRPSGIHKRKSSASCTVQPFWLHCPRLTC